jgi:hypothetical protein
MGNLIVLTDGEPEAKPAPKETSSNYAGEVLKQAIEKGAPVDTLERLLTLEMKYRAWQAELAYQQDFLAFKQEPGLKILRDEIVEYENKRGGGITKYAFSPLDRAEAVLIPLLAKHNFTHHWRTEPQPNGWTKVTAVIKHILCHENDSASLLGPPDMTGNKNGHQAIGSNVSYLERYTLCAACGITPQRMDTDARPMLVEEAVEPEEVAENPAPAIDKHLEKQVAAAGTMEELLKLWSELTEEQRKVMKDAFTARRKKLEVLA